ATAAMAARIPFRVSSATAAATAATAPLDIVGREGRLADVDAPGVQGTQTAAGCEAAVAAVTAGAVRGSAPCTAGAGNGLIRAKAGAGDRELGVFEIDRSAVGRSAVASAEALVTAELSAGTGRKSGGAFRAGFVNLI